MACTRKELIKWLQSVHDDVVYIDEGGLTLCCEETTSYYEIGGAPRGAPTFEEDK